MKRIFIFLILIFAASVAEAQFEQPRKVPERISGGITYSDDKQPEAVFRKLVFWTNCRFPSYIRIYVNNSFKGKVTRSYSSAPRSGSLGCVTVDVTGVSNIKLRAVDANGNEWSVPSMKIGLGYTHICLYPTGRRGSASSGTVLSSSSSGYSRSSKASSSSSHSNYSSSSSDNDSYSAGMRETAGKAGAAIGTALGYAMLQGKEWNSYSHRIDLGIGWGIDYGGLGVKINWQAPIVFGVTAGLGYNVFYKNKPGNDKPVYWNVGVQMWINDHWNFELGIGPRYYKSYDQNVLGVSAMMHYQHQVYRDRLGVIGGIGCSLGTKSPKGYKKDALGVGFEWNIGLVVRLFSR